MKKMLCIVSFIATGMMAQAISLTWGLGTGVSAGDTFANGIAYLLWDNTTTEGGIFSYDGDLSKQEEFLPSKFQDKQLAQTGIDASGFFSCKSTLTPGDVDASEPTRANLYMVAISADGKDMLVLKNAQGLQITNSAMSNTFTRKPDAFNSYTAVPEPTAMALLGLGIIALGLKRKVAK